MATRSPAHTASSLPRVAQPEGRGCSRPSQGACGHKPDSELTLSQVTSGAEQQCRGKASALHAPTWVRAPASPKGP